LFAICAFVIRANADESLKAIRLPAVRDELLQMMNDNGRIRKTDATDLLPAEDRLEMAGREFTRTALRFVLLAHSAIS